MIKIISDTPRPWKTYAGKILIANPAWKSEINCDILKVSSKTGFTQEIVEANAELIVRAVNCHDELIAALESAKSIIIGEFGSCNEFDELLKRAKGGAE